MIGMQERQQGLGIEVWPREPRIGERMLVAFRAAKVFGAMSVPRYEVMVLDERRRRVATLMRGQARPSGGVVCVDWDGRDDGGVMIRAGVYRLRVEGIGTSLVLERTMRFDP